MLSGVFSTTLKNSQFMSSTRMRYKNNQSYVFSVLSARNIIFILDPEIGYRCITVRYVLMLVIFLPNTYLFIEKNICLLWLCALHRHAIQAHFLRYLNLTQPGRPIAMIGIGNEANVPENSVLTECANGTTQCRTYNINLCVHHAIRYIPGYV